MSINFDLTDLRLFLAVAEECNLTRGAARVFLSPSAASTRIKELERQTRVTLFYRNVRGVELTDMGAKFMRNARLVLRQVDVLQEECEISRGDISGQLRIFANTTAVTEFLPGILADFMAIRPNLKVDMLERVTADILSGVLDGAADIGIVAGPVSTEGLQVLPFSTDLLVLVTPERHSLSNREFVTFTDVLDYQHIGLHDGSSHTAFLRQLAQQRGKQFKMRIQVRSFEAMCRMVGTGVGIALVPETAALRHQEQAKLAIVELREEWAVRERSVVVRELDGLSKAGQALIRDIWTSQGQGHPLPEM